MYRSSLQARKNSNYGKKVVCACGSLNACVEIFFAVLNVCFAFAGNDIFVSNGLSVL